MNNQRNRRNALPLALAAATLLAGPDISFACGGQSWSENGRHDLYSYNASSDIDELYDLRDPDPVNLSGRPEHAAARKHMIERLGAVLARDPRWLAYWSSFQVDHYFDLPRSLPGDLQLRVF